MYKITIIIIVILDRIMILFNMVIMNGYFFMNLVHYFLFAI